jgi:phage terminase large subunit GpA-like protein
VLAPHTTFIDSGGHHSKAVYAFTRARQFRRVFAIKGSSQEGAPLLGKPTRNNEARAISSRSAASRGKKVLAKRLARITEPGPGFVHLPAWLDVEQVTQFTRMRLVTPVNKGGRKWVKPKPAWEETGAVEQFVLYVYALAALQLVGPIALRDLGQIAKKQAEEARAKREAEKAEAPTKPDNRPESTAPDR